MPLTVITGPANSGKTGEAYARIRQVHRAGGRPVLLLPTIPDVERARSELSREIPTGLRAMTFESFIAEEWRSHGDGLRLVTPVQRELLLSSACEAAGAPRLFRTALDVIGHLVQTGDAWRTLPNLQGPVEKLCRCVSAYANALTFHELIEPGEAAWKLPGRIGRMEEYDIVAHRYADLTRSQERFLVDASKRGARVSVTLTWEPETARTAAAEPLVRRLLSLDEVSHVVAPADAQYTDSGELAGIAAELFAPTGRVEAEGDVAFIAAAGEQDEADRIAAEIVRLLGLGTEPERIAVVYRHAERRAGSLRRSLSEAGVAADFDVREPADALPMGRALSALSAFIASGDRGGLASALLSGYLAPTLEAVAAVDGRWRRNAVMDRGSLMTDLHRLDARAAASVREIARIKNGTPPTEAAEAWKRLVGHMLVCRRGRPGTAITDGIETDATCWTAIVRMLDEAVSLRVTVTASMLGELLGRMRINPVRAERPGRVQVLGAERIRGRRFSVVIVAGLNSGEFPLSADDPASSPALRELYRAAGAQPPEWGGEDAERALFYNVVTRARQRLVLMRRTTDDGGAPLGASVFWEQMRDFYRTPDPGSDEMPIPGVDIGDAPGSLATHSLLAGRMSQRQQARAARLQCDDAGLSDALAASFRRSRHPRGCVEDEAVRARLAARSVFSASELETYARCPYLWFVQHALRASTPDYEVDPLTRGSAVHRALQKAYEFLRERGQERIDVSTTDDELDELARASTAAAVSEAPDVARAALAAWVKPRVLRSLREDRRFATGFVPAHHEWPFGVDEPLELASGVAVRGIVDRIDVDTTSGRAFVLDYKSSHAYSRRQLEAGDAIQVPLYVRAVKDRLALDVVAGVYRNLADAKTRGFGVEGEAPAGMTPNDLSDLETIQALIDSAVSTAIESARGIQASRIEPRDCDRCAHCVVRGLCGVSP